MYLTHTCSAFLAVSWRVCTAGIKYEPGGQMSCNTDAKDIGLKLNVYRIGIGVCAVYAASRFNNMPDISIGISAGTLYPYAYAFALHTLRLRFNGPAADIGYVD